MTFDRTNPYTFLPALLRSALILPALAAVVLPGCSSSASSPANHSTQAPTAPEAPTSPTSAPSATTGTPTGSDRQSVTGTSNHLAATLWAQLPRGQNLAISPASIELALAMTQGGASGETASQMARVLGSSDGAVAHESHGQRLARWNDPARQAYSLTVANRLFGEQTFAWKPGFLTLTRDTYGAALEPVDFRGQPDPSRTLINDWVAQQTKGLIRDLIPDGGITSDTRMVLTNAIYFLADWRARFDRGETRPRAFHAPDGSRKVATMHQMNQFRYGETKNAQLLEMGYVGDDLAMVIALPRERDGLAALESELTAERFDSWVANLAFRSVAVSLPKFRVDPAEPLALAGILQKLGMVDAFDPRRADFGAMAEPAANSGARLFISAVFHKAFVAVDEKGTEAAAATAVVMADESAPLQPLDLMYFTAEHPFLFFIRDVHSGAIVFMGRVVSPNV